MDLDLGFIEIEYVEWVVILTILAWVVMYFVFKFWMEKVPEFNFWGYGIIIFILAPVLSVLLIKRISEHGVLIGSG